ncbi:MAG: hypothetical protein K8S87_09240 [Planctomycetes bacterium]|nr:hypothetical protein [Planctomycetota bacterium]
MKKFTFLLVFPIIVLISATSYSYPLDYLDPDYIPKGRRAHFSIDCQLAVIPRSVAFSDADDENEDETKPHIGGGFGILFPNGLNHIFGDFLGDYIGPIGFRIGYLTGGPLSPEGDALDLNNPDKEPYESTIFELDFMYPYGIAGRGFSFILSEWEYISTSKTDAKIQHVDIPAGTRMRQSIGLVGFELPFMLMDSEAIGFGMPTTAFGIVFRYEILILTLETLDPPHEAAYANHALLVGAYFNWGITERLFTEICIQLGNGLKSPSGFVGHIEIKL